MSSLNRELIDTIEYIGHYGVAVKLELWKEEKPIKGYKVIRIMSSSRTNRFFYTEKQANDYIVSLQR